MCTASAPARSASSRGGDGVGQGGALDEVLVCVEPAPHRVLAADPSPDGLQALHQEAGPVLDGPAVVVGAVVARRGEEGVDEVAVAGVQLHAVDPRGLGPGRRRREHVRRGGDVVHRHLVVVEVVGGRRQELRHLGRLLRGDLTEERIGPPRGGDRGHPQRTPGGGVVHALLARVGQLQAHAAAVGVHRIRQASQPGDEPVLGDARLGLVRRAGRVGDAHGAQHHERHPTLGPGFGVGQLGVRHRAVELAEVVPHGRHGDPVAQHHRTDPPRREQVRVGRTPTARGGHGHLTRCHAMVALSK